MEIFKNILLPIITFFLGVLFTVFWDKRKISNKKYNDSANRLFRLINDWYNQLYDLQVEQKLNSPSYERKSLVYMQNRDVLPEYLMILKFLTEKNKYSKLVEKAEEFLYITTDYRKKPEGEYFQDIRCRLPDSLSDVEEEINKIQLEKLDSLLQEIAIETGNIN